MQAAEEDKCDKVIRTKELIRAVPVKWILDWESSEYCLIAVCYYGKNGTGF